MSQKIMWTKLDFTAKKISSFLKSQNFPIYFLDHGRLRRALKHCQQKFGKTKTYTRRLGTSRAFGSHIF